MSNILSKVKAYYSGHPLVRSVVRHFESGFVAAFVVSAAPVVQDVVGGKSIDVGAERAVLVSAFVGALAAGYRAARPYALKAIGVKSA